MRRGAAVSTMVRTTIAELRVQTLNHLLGVCTPVLNAKSDTSVMTNGKVPVDTDLGKGRQAGPRQA